VKGFPRQSQFAKSGINPYFSVCRHQHKATRKLKNQRYVTPPKEHNNFLVADSKDMEISKLPEEKIKIIVFVTLQSSVKYRETNTENNK
jgi:hypothetical protein